MIYYTAEKERSNDNVIDTVQNDIDYVDGDGGVHVHVKSPCIMVTSQDDLANLTGYNPTTIAFTVDMANIWQLNASGEWVAIIAES